MSNEKMKDVGRRIKIIREFKNMTQEQLANKCGNVSDHARSWISKIESGQRNPTIDILSDIADGLGVPLVALFIDEEPTNTDMDIILRCLALYDVKLPKTQTPSVDQTESECVE